MSQEYNGSEQSRFAGIVVYGKPGCVQCAFTTRELDKQHLTYSYIDVTLNLTAEEQVKDMGFTSLPVVTTKDDKWYGFRPDRIRKLSAPTKEEGLQSGS